MQNERISHVAWDTVSPDWLPQALARASIVWVSRDSASMVYEALSSQAAVGLLDVPLQRRGRVSSGVEALRADGMVTAFDDWRQGRALQPPALALAEADRCAQWLEQAWLRDAG